MPFAFKTAVGIFFGHYAISVLRLHMHYAISVEIHSILRLSKLGK